MKELDRTNTQAGEGLCPQIRALYAAHPVRKSGAQKAAFRADAAALLEAAGWPVAVEEGGTLVKSRNLVAGRVEGARLVVGAHYDTPAILPFPNFLAPRNLLVSLVYQLVIAVLLCAVVFGAAYGLRLLGLSPLGVLLASWVVLLVLVVLMMAGPANRSNANDNTSGTLTVLEAALALPPEKRAGVAFVLFDNEEKGLLGSAAFRKRHAAAMKHTPLLNLDCVGDGDTLLFVQTRACRRDSALQAALTEAFTAPAGKRVLLDKSPLTLYPSDQANFKRGIGVAALRRAPLVGLYVSRLHTPWDTKLDEANVTLMRAGIIRLAGALAAGESPAPAAPPAG